MAKKGDNEEYDVNTWGPSDMIENQAELDAIANPTETVVVDTGGKTFRSENDVIKYIQTHGLNKVAKAMGGTIGGQKVGGKWKVVVQKPKYGRNERP